MSFAEIITLMPADRLADTVGVWLWERNDRPNWPPGWEVWALIEALQQRPDAANEAVKLAIADCHEYLRTP